MKNLSVVMVLGLALCALQACSKGHSSGSPPSSSATAVGAEQAGPSGFRYPYARWRLASFEELDRTTLWIGHIAVRHEHSQPDSFRPLTWRPDPPNPARTVAEALAIAERFAARAAADPTSFERLARTDSDDIVSRDAGGMLGGVRASQLTDGEFLDAFAALKPGEVSKAFRTPYGFHVVKRYAPPLEQLVAGERIVIGYDGVLGLEREARRSRAEALVLAREIAEQALKNPEQFAGLVDRYSENADRAERGNLGVHSTRDPEYFPAEVFRLAQLEVGGVTGPLDSRFGFEILKRVRVAPEAILPAAQPRLAELPAPTEPDYEALLGYNDGRQVAAAARALSEALAKSAEFTPAVTASIAATLGGLVDRLEQEPEDRAAVRADVYSALSGLARELSADDFARFKGFGQRWAVRQMMPPGSVD
jgi:parvulin-like peptidyl-prolyl isomerase